MDAHREIEFTVYLDQRPGELAGVLEAASAAGVDITSLATSEHRDRGCVRVLGRPAEGLRRVMESLVESGVGPVVEAEVIAVPINGRPKLVRDIAVAMADHRVNVRYCYLAPAAGELPARAVFRFDEIEAAERVFDRLDWIGLEPRAEGESAA